MSTPSNAPATEPAAITEPVAATGTAEPVASTATAEPPTTTTETTAPADSSTATPAPVATSATTATSATSAPHGYFAPPATALVDTSKMTAPTVINAPAEPNVSATTTATQPKKATLMQRVKRVVSRVVNCPGGGGSTTNPNQPAATTTGSLKIVLQNNSNSNQVYCYITGQAIDNNYQLFLLQADGVTPYYPGSPSSTGTALSTNVSILLGPPNTSITVTIPRLAGGRIWFSIGAELKFLLNPGPGLVEPSVFNPADPNINTNFGFCEFTFNAAQLFANISYVDFVSGCPIALTTQDTNGATQHVSGMPANGLETVCAGLRAQTQVDGQPWGSLVVQHNGADLRALSPNSGITLNPSWFNGYWTPYVNEVYARYASSPLTVNTQASYGNVNGTVDSAGALDFGNGCVFSPPTAADIFSSNSGPFATGSNAETNVIIPRLAAGFNRSVLLLSNQTPNGTNASQYYQNPITNHYARIVHAANVDGLGYTHPYDDVVPDGGPSQAGVVVSYAPISFTVAVGGNGAYAG